MNDCELVLLLLINSQDKIHMEPINTNQQAIVVAVYIANST